MNSGQQQWPFFCVKGILPSRIYTRYIIHDSIKRYSTEAFFVFFLRDAQQQKGKVLAPKHYIYTFSSPVLVFPRT